MAEDNYQTPRNLSAQATQEILGDDLVVAFAIAKNGKIVRLYPHGVDSHAADKLSLADTDSTQINIPVRIPKISADPGQTEDALLGSGCVCIVNGKPVRC